MTAAAGDKGEQITTHAVQPAFDPEIFEYRTFVNVTTASVKVTLTANDTQSDGLITVNGTSRAGGVAFDVPLAHGVTVLAVAVVSGDGTTTKRYTYKITRASDDTVTNATLSFLEVTLDDGVVLKSQLAEQLAMIIQRAQDQNIALPPAAELREQILERLIITEVQLKLEIT